MCRRATRLSSSKSRWAHCAGWIISSMIAFIYGSAAYADRYFVGLPGGGTGNWNDPLSWSATAGGPGGAGLPGAGDLAFLQFGDSVDRNIVLDTSATTAGLQIGNTAGGTVTLLQGSGFDLTTPYENLGVYNSEGVLSFGAHVQTGGTNHTGHLLVGNDFGPMIGMYSISGGTLNADSISVGGYGGGKFIQDGGFVSGGIHIGAADKTSIYEFHNGTLNATGISIVDESDLFGTATFIQSGGVSTIGYIDIGEGDFATGTFILSGASARLTVLGSEATGLHGDGVYVQSAGTCLVQGKLWLGGSSGTGTYNLSGGTYTVLGGMQLGDLDGGIFNQTGGVCTVGTTSANSDLNLTVGHYILSGGSSSLTVYGNESVTGYGSFVQNAGNHSVSGKLTVDESGGSFLLAGGTLQVGGDEVLSQRYNNGKFIQTGGAHSIGGNLIIAEQPLNKARFDLQDGSLIVSGDEVVGGAGLGQFLQSNGVHVLNGLLQLATTSSGEGSFTLAGGSLRALGGEYVGNAGIGIFDQTAGFHSVGATSANQDLWIGRAGGLGIFTSEGPASLITYGTEFIGHGGSTGILRMINSGNNATNAVVVGDDSAGAGSLILSDASLLTPFLDVRKTGTFTVFGTYYLLSQLEAGTFSVAGHVTFAPNGYFTPKVKSLSIDNASAKFDLGDNKLIVDYTGTAGTLAQDVRQSLLAGALFSSVGTTTSRVGYGDNALLHMTRFGQQFPDSTSFLIGYTFAGDTNLDGKVDVTDLGALATNWQTSGFWTEGDFNYDGFVDATDLGLLATNWQAGVPHPFESAGLDEALAAVGLGGVMIPEPATIAVLAAAFLALTFCFARRARCIGAVLVLICVSSVARADRYFVGLPGGGTGNWNDPLNWSETPGGAGGAGLPGAGDVAYIENDDALDRNITLDVNATTAGLVIANIGFNQNSVTTLNQSGSFDLDTAFEYLGTFDNYNASRAAHVQSGGTNHTGELRVGSGIYASGTYTINGGTLDVSGDIYVGYFGQGMFVQNGGFVSGGLGIGGYHREGTYLLNAGTLQSGGVIVGNGDYSAGKLIQSGGTHITGGMTLGEYDYCSGEYVLNGASASLIVNGDEVLGVHGGGIVQQSAGDHRITGRLLLRASIGGGEFDLSGGTLTVLGGEQFGSLGGGFLNQTGGVHTVGTVSANADILVEGPRGGFVLNGSSSVLRVYGGEIVDGPFTQYEGDHALTQILSVGDGTASSGIYSLSGGSLSAGGGEIVGNFGNGTFVQTGGTNATPSLSVGSMEGSNGTFLMGGGTLNADNGIVVGYRGAGTFIQNGGIVDGWVGVGDIANTGVYLQNGGTLVASGVGVGNSDYGIGTFAQSGGVTTVGNPADLVRPALALGEGDYAVGTYTLSGSNSSLTVYGIELFGFHGNGAFIQSGGTHTLVGTLLMGQSSGWGIYNLNGGTFLAQGPEIIGDGFAGTFTQSGGAHIVGSAGSLQTIAVGHFSPGVYALSGTSSVLSVFGNELVGDRSNGQFVQATGNHSVSGTLSIGDSTFATGQFVLAGGSLSVGGNEIVGRLGQGTFIHSGGENSTTSLFLGGISPQNFGAGTYLMTGGRLNASYGIFVGPGLFTQTGGTVTTNNFGIGPGPVPGAPNGAGTYEMSGGALITTVSGFGEEIGQFSSGTFIQLGGTHTAAGMTVGKFADGTYLLSRSDSTLAVYGVEELGYHGSGTFIQSGGNNFAVNGLSLGTSPPGRGSFFLSGGSLTVYGGEDVGLMGAGTFTQTGGSHTVSGAYGRDNTLSVGGEEASAFYLSGASATLFVYGNEAVSAQFGDALFQQAGGSNTATGTVSISPDGNHGRYEMSGGTLTAAALSVGSAGTFTYSGGTLNVGTLNVAGHVTFAQAAHLAPHVNALSIGNATAKVDLADNSLVVDYGNAPGTLVDDVRQSLLSGALFTSVENANSRLGYADEPALNRLLIQFTYAGDSNLDGQVDVTDLGALATNWQTAGVWTGGDFNYDGFVDVTDLGLLASNWQAGVGGPLASTSLVESSPGSFEQAIEEVGLSLTSVPEPSGLTVMVLVSLAAWLSVACRRR